MVRGLRRENGSDWSDPEPERTPRAPPAASSGNGSGSFIAVNTATTETAGNIARIARRIAEAAPVVGTPPGKAEHLLEKVGCPTASRRHVGTMAERANLRALNATIEAVRADQFDAAAGFVAQVRAG